MFQCVPCPGLLFATYVTGHPAIRVPAGRGSFLHCHCVDWWSVGWHSWSFALGKVSKSEGRPSVLSSSFSSAHKNKNGEERPPAVAATASDWLDGCLAHSFARLPQAIGACRCRRWKTRKKERKKEGRRKEKRRRRATASAAEEKAICRQKSCRTDGRTD